METRPQMLARLKAGMRVRIDIRGRVFWAVLVSRTEDGWNIDPEGRQGRSYRHVTTRQIREAEKGWSPWDSQIHRTNGRGN